MQSPLSLRKPNVNSGSPVVVVRSTSVAARTAHSAFGQTMAESNLHDDDDAADAAADSDTDSLHISGMDGGAVTPKWTLNNVLRESRLQLRMAAPVVLGNLLWFSANLVAMMFVGRIEENSPRLISAVAIAAMFTNITGFSLGFGLTSGIETIGGQAFGAQNYALVGRVYQRTIVLMTLFCIPVAVLWWNSQTILLWFIPSEEIALLSARYIRWMIPSLWPSLVCNATSIYLEVQSIMSADIYVGALVTLCNGVTCYLLINVLGWGIDGAAIAMTISMWCALGTLISVVLLKGWHRRTWRHWDRHQSFHHLNRLLELCLPGMFMHAAEWWAFEILLVFAGWFSPAGGEMAIAVAVMGLINQIGSVCYMIPMSSADVANTRVSNLLGAQQPSLARFAALISTAVTLFIALLYTVPAWIWRMEIGRLWTRDQKIIDTFGVALSIFVWTMPLDALQSTSVGIMRGLGGQKIGMIVNLIGYYVIGLPVSYYLAFDYHHSHYHHHSHHSSSPSPITPPPSSSTSPPTAAPPPPPPPAPVIPSAALLPSGTAGLGVDGLMIGWLIGLAAVVAMFAVAIGRIDWEKEAADALRRTATEREEERALLLDETAEEAAHHYGTLASY